MAQTIMCDAPGCPEAAVALLTFFSPASTQGYCAGHFAEFVMASAVALAQMDDSAAEAAEEDMHVDATIETTTGNVTVKMAAEEAAALHDEIEALEEAGPQLAQLLQTLDTAEEAVA